MRVATERAQQPGEPDDFRLELETDLSRVGDAVEYICARCLDDAAASARIRFRLCTILAEAIANAMLYGNGGEPDRRVLIDVTQEPERLVIGVTDEGNGFDHSAIPFPLCDDSLAATRGRGLFMIHRLADRVTFNDRGNTIWMTLPRR
jgi:serine/threonine-protein kinase RsbW